MVVVDVVAGVVVLGAFTIVAVSILVGFMLISNSNRYPFAAIWTLFAFWFLGVPGEHLMSDFCRLTTK